MRILTTVMYLIIILFGLTFAALNATSVRVNFYVTVVNTPISVLMVVTLGIGILIGVLLFLGRHLRLKSELRRLKNQLKMTEKEVKNLRSIPLQDQP